MDFYRLAGIVCSWENVCKPLILYSPNSPFLEEKNYEINGLMRTPTPLILVRIQVPQPQTSLMLQGIFSF